ncbi:Maltose/maltodextrin ABC transporter, permease protein MalF [Labilithrix luteola]|uniref:Maltose/maltodextrin ABC transporter, permease protein MalF n=1 Tax=Labilithrix luteola TaxID=1391654 RepID=A0A0K1PZN0_9BACT|nr:sugar ABC transporter permease [Labilithrix luteola]AKU98609.1 Maltose/maltodextrin ABC transporter, permease protein MalF [Labilithrix luteola]
MSPTPKERLTPWLFVAPSVLVFLVVAAYPIGYAVWLSLRRVIIVFHEDRFVGLQNFAFLLRDPRFWTALGNTAYFSFVAVSIEIVLGLAFALLLNTAFPGKKLLRASILVPWAIPTVVSAKTWAWLFNPDYGLVTKLLPGHDIDWLGMPGYAMHAAIVVDVWKTTPFVALLLLAGLTGIPDDVYRAAAIDGASTFRTFRSITLPLLRPTIVVTLVFRTLDAFRVFDAVYVLTGGGPANTTETLSIYAYKMLVRVGDFGYGSALAVVTFFCVMAISAGYIRLLGLPGKEESP